MEEIDLKELLQMFWQKKVLIISILVLFIVLGIIYSLYFVTPKYQSTTKLLLATNSSSQQENLEGETTITTTDVTINSKLVSTYSELVKSNKIIRAVIANLGIQEDEESIRKNVSVRSVADTEVIEISVISEDPELAARIANEIAEVFIENVKEFYGIDNVHIVDKAERENVPSNINYAKDVTIFAFIGFAVSILYLFLSNLLDTKIKSEEDIEKISGLTILASFPIYDEKEVKIKGKRRGGKKQ